MSLKSAIILILFYKITYYLQKLQIAIYWYCKILLFTLFKSGMIDKKAAMSTSCHYGLSLSGKPLIQNTIQNRRESKGGIFQLS